MRLAPLLLLTAACAGRESPPAEQAAAPPAAAASGIEPCSTLTPEEIQAAVGWTVARSDPKSSSPGYFTCTWASANGGSVMPPETVEAGITMCFTNIPCSNVDMPGQFASSAAMAEFRRGVYKGTSYEAMNPVVEPVEGLGVPAVIHELGGLYSMEMFLGEEKMAFVTLWTGADAARALGEKVLARVR